MNNSETTFWKTIRAYRIVIPRIQRDYVQGRKTRLVENARDTLLMDIYESCATDKPTSLNFVYGKVDGPEDDERFLPLDGQQRLTTLYLLHWIALLESDLDPSEGCASLARFSYETRTSSADFFNRLTDPIHVLELRGTEGKLSELVWDKSWFRPEWKDDPTVQSCLTVLDCLQDQFSDHEGLWETLTSDDCPIRFEWLDIRDIGNDDDLYIKMNARGKVLSPFENLKAEIEQEARKLLDDDEYESLVERLDGRWSDLIWTIGDDPAKHEERFMSLVNWSLWNHWAAIAEIPSAFSGLESFQRDFAARTLRDFSKELPEGETAFDKTWLCSFSRMLDAVTADESPSDARAIITRCTGADGTVTYADLFMLQALSAYLDGTDGVFEEQSWSQWMRVMGNFMRSSERYQGFNTIGRFANAIKCVDRLSVHARDILAALADEDIEVEGIIPGDQIVEEQMKARLILLSPEWRRAIKRAEGIPYFMGKILFLLEFSGIHDIAGCSDADADALTTFEGYTDILEVLFDAGSPAVDGVLLRRALLTKGDYSMAARQLKSYLVDNDRRIDWRGFLRLYDDEHQRTNVHFKTLLDDLLKLNGSIEERLQSIITEYTWDNNRKDWWAKLFIEDETLFKELGRNYQFRQVSDRWSVSMLMMPKGANKVASGRNKELITTIAANELRKQGWNVDMYGMIGFQPGRYCTVKSGDQSFDLGLAEFASDKPYVIWNSKTGQEVYRSKADAKKMVGYILTTT